MIPFIGWLADRGVDAAAWASMSGFQQDNIKAQYEADVPASQREYDVGAGFENINPTGQTDPAYQLYQNNGGTYNFDAWVSAGRPLMSEQSRGEPDADDRGNPPADDFGDGDGEELTDLDKALAGLQAKAQAFSERKAAEAQRLGARDIGKFSTDIRRALLATGRSAGEIEQLSAAGIEGGARSQNDLLQQLALQGQQTQLAIGEFGIGAKLPQEDINARLLMASQRLSLGERNLEEGIRQFDVTQRNRPSPWQGLFSGIGQGFGDAAGSAFGTRFI